MDMMDYDRALYYTHRSDWDNLIVLMVRTKDHLLSKRIEHFMHAYQFSQDYSLIERRLFSLLRYLEHANESVCSNPALSEDPLLTI